MRRARFKQCFGMSVSVSWDDILVEKKTTALTLSFKKSFANAHK
jgi:hypothetical protein